MTSSRRLARFSILPDRPPTQELKAYSDQHRDIYGVEPICKVLQIAPSCYRRHAAQLGDPALRCERAKQDDELIPHVQRVWHANMQVYGADKVWKQLNRKGVAVPRCSVERLMRQLGLGVVRRGRVVRTTVSNANAPCPLDRVNRHFKAKWPHQALGMRTPVEVYALAA
jgi:hypothetical protein